MRIKQELRDVLEDVLYDYKAMYPEIDEQHILAMVLDSSLIRRQMESQADFLINGQDN